jgi:hypothetical protein
MFHSLLLVQHVPQSQDTKLPTLKNVCVCVCVCVCVLRVEREGLNFGWTPAILTTDFHAFSLSLKENSWLVRRTDCT